MSLLTLAVISLLVPSYGSDNTMPDCPVAATFKGDDLKKGIGLFSKNPFSCSRNPVYKCKAASATPPARQTCPKYESDGDDKYIEQNDIPQTDICEYKKICQCPASVTSSYVVNSKWPDVGDWKCSGKRTDVFNFKCFFKGDSTKNCPNYKTSKDQSHQLAVEIEEGSLPTSDANYATHKFCTYTKNCGNTGKRGRIEMNGAQQVETKVKCEVAGICDVFCFPTFCQNVYIKASSGVTNVNVDCKNDYACIGEVKINGAVTDSEGGNGHQNRDDKISGQIVCGWGSTNKMGKSCQSSLFGFRKLTKAVFRGDATNSRFVFKNIGSKHGVKGGVQIIIGKTSMKDAMTGAFASNAIFTQKVKRFRLKALSGGSLDGSFIDLRGLINTEQGGKGAEIKCYGKKTCNGLILVAKTCGGNIKVKCNGPDSCDGLQIIIQALTECHSATEFNDASTTGHNKVKVTTTQTYTARKPKIFVLYPVSTTPPIAISNQFDLKKALNRKQMNDFVQTSIGMDKSTGKEFRSSVMSAINVYEGSQNIFQNLQSFASIGSGTWDAVVNMAAAAGGATLNAASPVGLASLLVTFPLQITKLVKDARHEAYFKIDEKFAQAILIKGHAAKMGYNDLYYYDHDDEEDVYDNYVHKSPHMKRVYHGKVNRKHKKTSRMLSYY